MNVIEVTAEQITELAEDPNLESIHAGRIISDQLLYPVYDTDYGVLFEPPQPLLMEAEEEVIVTKHRDGTYFMHFMSLEPKRYHYKAPWIFDDQVTHDEGALYHV
jgi:hypothetical protein